MLCKCRARQFGEEVGSYPIIDAESSTFVLEMACAKTSYQNVLSISKLGRFDDNLSKVYEIH